MCGGEANRSDHSLAVLCLVLNIFVPGFGTIINAYQSHHNRGTGVCIGILQFLLTVFLIGWIWSIVYGINIVHQSSGHHGEHGHGHGHEHGHHDDFKQHH